MLSRLQHNLQEAAIGGGKTLTLILEQHRDVCGVPVEHEVMYTHYPALKSEMVRADDRVHPATAVLVLALAT